MDGLVVRIVVHFNFWKTHFSAVLCSTLDDLRNKPLSHLLATANLQQTDPHCHIPYIEI